MASSFFRLCIIKSPSANPTRVAALFFSLVVRVLRALAQQVVPPVR